MPWFLNGGGGTNGGGVDEAAGCGVVPQSLGCVGGGDGDDGGGGKSNESPGWLPVDAGGSVDEVSRRGGQTGTVGSNPEGLVACWGAGVGVVGTAGGGSDAVNRSSSEPQLKQNRAPGSFVSPQFGHLIGSGALPVPPQIAGDRSV